LKILEEAGSNKHSVIKAYANKLKIQQELAVSKTDVQHEKPSLSSSSSNVQDDKQVSLKKHPDSKVSQFKPRLFILSIGISKYKDPRFTLGYAAHDAKSIAKTLKNQPTSTYREIRVKTLIDSQVSRESILETMNSFLGRAVSSDVVLMFLAGHGLRRSSTRTFYFLPYSANINNLTTHALRWSDFEEEVKHISKRVKNVILMLDTCHSGALKISMRGVDRSQPKLSSLFNQRGLYVLSASRPDEEAMENSEWSHGAFTYAILDGLTGKADADKNKQIDIVELFHYVEYQVADITNGFQHPHFQMGGGSLPLYSLP